MTFIMYQHDQPSAKMGMMKQVCDGFKGMLGMKKMSNFTTLQLCPTFSNFPSVYCLHYSLNDTCFYPPSKSYQIICT